MSRSPLVLVVDDEAPIREVIRRYLRADGIDVIEAADGVSALEAFTAHAPDVVILDVMLPGLDGIEVLRRLRAKSDVYVLMLTARVDEVDRVIGLSVGADDYVSKPFSPRELTLRVKALLRRSRTVTSSESAAELDGLRIDGSGREVTVDGVPVELSALEFDLLVTLSSSPGQVFSRRQLLERVWGYDYYGDERVVDVHIAHVRRVLGDDAETPRWIATVRGAGYKFVGGLR